MYFLVLLVAFGAGSRWEIRVRADEEVEQLPRDTVRDVLLVINTINAHQTFRELKIINIFEYSFLKLII